MKLWFALLAACCYLHAQTIQVAPNDRFLQTSDSKPFFWLGDTAWLLFHNLTREETLRYLDDRQRKGFNVIQTMVLRSLADKNAYGARALAAENAAHPEPGPYWDGIEWVIDRARERGIHVALVCAWGTLVKTGKINSTNVEAYTRFLAQRYRSKPNIVWVTGGDARGDQHTEVWRTMGRILKELDPNHLITYHPFGRTQSSTWIHNEPWLAFNMFQSGHRRYDQDDTPNPKGEDNWRYVQEDYARVPAKPTLDAEPSYENVPQGLHDPRQPTWTAADVRRYAWWSVLAGACGRTYGENAVMQMHKARRQGTYNVSSFWYEGLDAPGAAQMQHLKGLLLSRPFFERVPDQTLVAGDNGARHEYIVASRGRSYALLYTWTGRTFQVNMGRISGKAVRAAWFNPRTGEKLPGATFPNTGTRVFDPPGKPAPGNDWALVLDDAGEART